MAGQSSNATNTGPMPGMDCQGGFRHDSHAAGRHANQARCNHDDRGIDVFPAPRAHLGYAAISGLFPKVGSDTHPLPGTASTTE